VLPMFGLLGVWTLGHLDTWTLGHLDIWMFARISSVMIADKGEGGRARKQFAREQQPFFCVFCVLRFCVLRPALCALCSVFRKYILRIRYVVLVVHGTPHRSNAYLKILVPFP
jgi:hypothetical protein